MSTKRILDGLEARLKLMTGIDMAANAITATLGPKGQNAILEQPGRLPPRITKDGVSVAKEIHLECPFENMGAELLAQIAHKTCNDAGDGTTTASLLAQSIYREGLKSMSVGMNAVDLKKGIDIAVDLVVKELERQATPITGEKDLEHIATISANGDEGIGKILAEAFTKVGKDGMITLVEGKSPETTLEFENGIQMQMGYHPSSESCVTHADTRTCEYRDCALFFHEHSFPNEVKLLALIDIVQRKDDPRKEPVPLLVMADSFNTEICIPMINVNNARKNTKICPVELPPMIENEKERQFRRDFLTDFCVLTGGRLMESEEGQIFTDHISHDYFGFAESIIVSRDHTTIIGGVGKPEDVERHKLSLQDEQKRLRDRIDFDPEYDRHLSKRLRNFNGVAIIRAGGSTLTEISERKDRIEDAMHATQASMEEGIVPGGGMALIGCESILDRAIGEIKNHNIDVEAGMRIVKRVLSAPLTKIIENAGKNAGLIIGQLKDKDYGFGYNASTDVIENFLETGVVDPAKVVRSTLQNAASIAGLMLTTGPLITYVDRNPNPMAGYKLKM